MTDVTIARDGDKIIVHAPYNPSANADYKAAGGRWNPGVRAWGFDARSEEKVREILRRHFGTDGQPGETVDVRVDADKVLGHISDSRGEGRTLRLFGREVLSRRARDADVRLGDGVVLVEGYFGGRAGSVQYPTVGDLSGVILEVRDVPAAHADLDEDGVTIIDRSVDVDALKVERDRLAARSRTGVPPESTTCTRWTNFDRRHPMTPQRGRPGTGEQIATRIPERDIARLDVLAAANGVKRADEIRTAVTNHLGPDVDPNQVAARVADIQANAWDWWPRTRHSHDLPKWGDQIAHAITQANAIIKLHSQEWDVDLTPVWEAIAAGEQDPEDIHGEGPDWAHVLTEFAHLIRRHVGRLDEWVSVHVDIVHWTLSVSTGGLWGAMQPTTYSWLVDGGTYNMAARNEVRARMEMADNETPDRFGVAAQLILGRFISERQGWGAPAPLVDEAVELLYRDAVAPPEVVDMLVARWEEHRRQEARTRLSQKGIWGGDDPSGVELLAEKLGVPRPQETPASDDVLAVFDAEVSAGEEWSRRVKAAWERRLQEEMGEMRREEEASRADNPPSDTPVEGNKPRATPKGTRNMNARIADFVATSLNTTDASAFDIDAIAEEIVDTYGHDVDLESLDSAEYWSIIERHDTSTPQMRAINGNPGQDVDDDTAEQITELGIDVREVLANPDGDR